MQKFKEQLKRIEVRDKQPKTDLVEIFSSFQGEGLFIGAKQIFIRFAGCNLSCCFCDTTKEAAIKGATVAEVIAKVNGLERSCGTHHSVSLTGGEPLLHVEFLEYLLPRLKRERFKIYLETNGTLSEELRRIISYTDIIAMDIKLPSSSGMPPLWDRHIEFLKIARKRNIFVKVVITNDTSQEDVIQARDIVEGFDNNMLFVLQPANPTEKGNFAVGKEKILNYQALVKKKLRNVRIIPQTHKFTDMK